MPAAICPTTCPPHTVTGPRAPHFGGPGDSAQIVCTVLPRCTSNPPEIIAFIPSKGLDPSPPCTIGHSRHHSSRADAFLSNSSHIYWTTVCVKFALTQNPRLPISPLTELGPDLEALRRLLSTTRPQPPALSRSSFPRRFYEHGYPHWRFSRPNPFLNLYILRFAALLSAVELSLASTPKHYPTDTRTPQPETNLETGHSPHSPSLRVIVATSTKRAQVYEKLRPRGTTRSPHPPDLRSMAAAP